MLYAQLKQFMADWERAREILRPSIVHCHGTHTEDDIFQQMCSGQMKLWLWDKSAALTEFTVYPRMKVLNIFLVGGDLRELMRREPEIQAFAKASGCARITAAGRWGWKKEGQGAGWSFNCMAMHKDI